MRLIFNKQIEKVKNLFFKYYKQNKVICIIIKKAHNLKIIFFNNQIKN